MICTYSFFGSCRHFLSLILCGKLWLCSTVCSHHACFYSEAHATELTTELLKIDNTSRSKLQINTILQKQLSVDHSSFCSKGKARNFVPHQREHQNARFVSLCCVCGLFPRKWPCRRQWQFLRWRCPSPSWTLAHVWSVSAVKCSSSSPTPPQPTAAGLQASVSRCLPSPFPSTSG